MHNPFLLLSCLNLSLYHCISVYYMLKTLIFRKCHTSFLSNEGNLGVPQKRNHLISKPLRDSNSSQMIWAQLQNLSLAKIHPIKWAFQGCKKTHFSQILQKNWGKSGLSKFILYWQFFAKYTSSSYWATYVKSHFSQMIIVVSASQRAKYLRFIRQQS